MGFPGVSDGKESACNEGDPGSITGSGRFPGEGNSKLLRRYSCLKNSMDRRTWWDQSMGSQRSDMTEWLALSLSGTSWHLSLEVLLAVNTSYHSGAPLCSLDKTGTLEADGLGYFHSFTLVRLIQIVSLVGKHLLRNTEMCRLISKASFPFFQLKAGRNFLPIFRESIGTAGGKRPWCLEGLKVGGEGDDRGQDG